MTHLRSRDAIGPNVFTTLAPGQLPCKAQPGREGTRWAMLVCMLGAIAACTFEVDTTLDAPDADTSDYRCERALRAGESESEAAIAGRCTLRAAIMQANVSTIADNIIVPAGTYNLTLPAAAGGGSLDVTNSVRIHGAGRDTTIIDQQTNAGVFLLSKGTIELNNVTITGGQNQAGAGVRIGDATVEMADVRISDNDAFTGGGGILVTSGGTLRLHRGAIVDNHATGAFGGGIWNQGTLWVYASTISHNDSNRAGGIRNSGNMNLRNTTVSHNTAHSSGAGVGGISQNRFAVLNNVTITANQGVGNSAGSFRGGGIQTSTGETTVMKNSIVAGNDGGSGPDDCVGKLTADSKYNLIGDSTGCTIPAYVATFLLDVNPLLNPLAANGGTTSTHSLAAASPARESGYQYPPPAADACESHDQRGVPRPQGGGRCDMGALEMTSANYFVTGFVLVDATTGSDIRPLLHGDIVNLNKLPAALSVRANVSGSPVSVVFDFDSTEAFQIEHNPPYALGGDSGGSYNPVMFAAGQRMLRATPFAAADGSGAAGGSLWISFLVQAEE